MNSVNEHLKKKTIFQKKKKSHSKMDSSQCCWQDIRPLSK